MLMQLVKLSIPYSFIASRVDVTWSLLKFGLENELVEPYAVVEATEIAIQTSEVSGPLLSLIGAHSEEVAALVSKLAKEEPTQQVERVWLFLVLAWIYHNKTDNSDALESVERVYAEFEYPEEIASFVRYMPKQGPDLASRSASEERLLLRWTEYLEVESARFRKKETKASLF